MRVWVQESNAMSNVISFPQKIEKAQRAIATGGAKTLFLHIKNTTMIVHLAAAAKTQAAGNRVGKKV